jgi:hypothetical protein
MGMGMYMYMVHGRVCEVRGCGDARGLMVMVLTRAALLNEILRLLSPSPAH